MFIKGNPEKSVQKVKISTTNNWLAEFVYSAKKIKRDLSCEKFQYDALDRRIGTNHNIKYMKL